ncbi:MAG: hypothetical protein JSW60_05020 [Thermoplasmatales archaeon]|nr:MAG: hypothetical protein JSW60_05020 [Thermoplasmatales archaeon]
MDAESIKTMRKDKNDLQQKANEFKKKRDMLHEKSKNMAKERDELNVKIRKIRNQISETKKRRDDYNERVKHAKEQRNGILKNHFDLKKKIKDLERDKSSALGVNLNKLKQNLRKLENEQMTQPMSPDKEKKLIETIKDIHMKIKEQEEELNKDPKLKKALEEKKILKQKAEKQHEIVEKIAKKAQEEHQSMVELLGQLDNLIKRTTEIQENIVTTKIEADAVHKEFINYVNSIHELEKKIVAIEKKKDQKKKMATVSAAKREAYEIYERFKKGEKLSTEDLMILQKAGLL